MRKRQEIYLDILALGLIIIRVASSQGDSDQCNAEADHLHNIPELLGNLDIEELHTGYWEAMRGSYLKAGKPEYAEWYTGLWQELEASISPQ